MRIWFTNKKDGITIVSAMVFNLESKITEIKSS